MPHFVSACKTCLALIAPFCRPLVPSVPREGAGGAFSAEELQQWCRGRIAGYKIPRYIKVRGRGGRAAAPAIGGREVPSKGLRLELAASQQAAGAGQPKYAAVHACLGWAPKCTQPALPMSRAAPPSWQVVTSYPTTTSGKPQASALPACGSSSVGRQQPGRPCCVPAALLSKLSCCCSSAAEVQDAGGRHSGAGPAGRCGGSGGAGGVSGGRYGGRVREKCETCSRALQQAAQATDSTTT